MRRSARKRVDFSVDGSQVKTVEEYYDGNGPRNERYTSELVTFKLAD